VKNFTIEKAVRVVPSASNDDKGTKANAINLSYFPLIFQLFS
jgi:hypothetical protein